MIKSRNLFAILLSSTMVFSCGGGGSSSSSSSATPAPIDPMIYVGQFIDAKVSGLNFSTATQTGTTSSEGEFSYQLDEKIQFSIGATMLPEITATSIITPLDVFASQDLDNQQIINLTRLLQSLDTDGYADNGIEISANVQQVAANYNLDFSSADFETMANDMLNEINGYYITLISEEQAMMHLQLTLEQLGQVSTNTCGNTHPLVGYTANFEGFFHEVAGKVTVINDCTIEISEFYYDGLGPDVYIYAGTDHVYDVPSAFSISRKINGPAFEDTTLTLRLPTGKTLDDFNGLSVWCVAVSADFGHVDLTL